MSFLNLLLYLLIFLLIIVIAVILLALIIISLVLIMPVKLVSIIDYKNHANGLINISWLFRFVQYKLIITENNFVQQLQILGFKLKSPKKKVGTDKNIGEDEEENLEAENQVPEDIYDFDEDIDENTKDDESTTSEYIATKRPNFIIRFKNKFIEVFNILKEFISKLSNIMSLMQTIYNHKDKEVILFETKKVFKKICKSFKVKKFKVGGSIGFDDPSVTGMFVAIESLILSFTNLDIRIAGEFGEFEKTVFDLNSEINCKFSLHKLIIPLLFYYFKKPMNTHITHLISHIKDN